MSYLPEPQPKSGASLLPIHKTHVKTAIEGRQSPEIQTFSRFWKRTECCCDVRMSWRRNSGLDNRQMTSPTSSTNFRSHSDICRTTAETSGFRPHPGLLRLVTSSRKMALMSGCHLATVSVSTSMKAVLRAELEFSLCQSTGDCVLLERFESSRPDKSSFLVNTVEVSAFVLRRLCVDDLPLLRLRLLRGNIVFDIELFS